MPHAPCPMPPFQYVVRGKVVGIDPKTSLKKTVDLDVRVVVVDNMFKRYVSLELIEKMVVQHNTHVVFKDLTFETNEYFLYTTFIDHLFDHHDYVP